MLVKEIMTQGVKAARPDTPDSRYRHPDVPQSHQRVTRYR